jgi:hypothetical protein
MTTPIGVQDWSRDLPIPDQQIASISGSYTGFVDLGNFHMNNTRAIYLSFSGTGKQRLAAGWLQGGSAQGNSIRTDTFDIFTNSDIIEVPLRVWGGWLDLSLTSSGVGPFNYNIGVSSLVDLPHAVGDAGGLKLVGRTLSAIGAGGTITDDFNTYKHGPVYVEAYSPAATYTFGLDMVDFTGTHTGLIRSDNVSGPLRIMTFLPAGHGQMIANNTSGAASVVTMHAFMSPTYL